MTSTVLTSSEQQEADGGAPLFRGVGRLDGCRHGPPPGLREPRSARLRARSSRGGHSPRPRACSRCDGVGPGRRRGPRPPTFQCYLGGEQGITAADLVEDPARDRRCTTLGGALGRSINTVFARLARTYLTPKEPDAMATLLGMPDLRSGSTSRQAASRLAHPLTTRWSSRGRRQVVLEYDALPAPGGGDQRHHRAAWRVGAPAQGRARVRGPGGDRASLVSAGGRSSGSRALSHRRPPIRSPP